MRGRALLLVASALLGALAPPAASQGEPVEAVFLVYHVEPDPLASPHAPLPPGLAVQERALRLPATRFDGVLHASDAPEGDPTSVLARFTDGRDRLLLRRSTGAPATILLEGGPGFERLRLNATFAPREDLSGLALEARVVVFEDLVPDALEDRAHRFVARLALPPEPVDLSNGPVPLERLLPVDRSWSFERLGVAVSLVHVGESPRHRAGEVIQSAVWLARQEGPTRQEEKAVLVEHATGSWCEACRPADEALVLLASQYGPDAAQAGPARHELRVTPLALAGLAAGLLAGVLLLRRRTA